MSLRKPCVTCARPWALTTTEPESGEFSDHRLRSNPLASQPSAWVVRFGQSLRPGARVLDLACGHGRQAAWFALRGCQVTAVDVDPACEASLRQHPGVRFVLADLEAGPWPLADERFDAVVVVHYLHRPLLARIRAALARDGLLIYETFATGNERFGRPRNPDFLLRPGELLTAFRRSSRHRFRRRACVRTTGHDSAPGGPELRTRSPGTGRSAGDLREQPDARPGRIAGLENCL